MINVNSWGWQDKHDCGNPDSIPDETIPTCYYYEYDPAHRVTKETVFSNSSVYSLTVEENHSANYFDGTNTWKRKTVEQEPDGSSTTVYVNYYLCKTLLVDKATSGGIQHWITYSQYDDSTVIPCRVAATIACRNGVSSTFRCGESPNFFCMRCGGWIVRSVG